MTIRATPLQLVLAAVISVVALLLLFRGPSDETRIRRLLAEMAELVEKGGEEHPIESARRGNLFCSHLTPSLRTEVPELGFRSRSFSRDEVFRQFVAARGYSGGITVSLEHLSVRLSDRAHATATADVLVRGLRTGWHVTPADVRALEVALIRNDGEWLISSASVLPIVEQ